MQEQMVEQVDEKDNSSDLREASTSKLLLCKLAKSNGNSEH